MLEDIKQSIKEKLNLSEPTSVYGKDGKVDVDKTEAALRDSVKELGDLQSKIENRINELDDKGNDLVDEMGELDLAKDNVSRELDERKSQEPFLSHDARLAELKSQMEKADREFKDAATERYEEYIKSYQKDYDATIKPLEDKRDGLENRIESKKKEREGVNMEMAKLERELIDVSSVINHDKNCLDVIRRVKETPTEEMKAELLNEEIVNTLCYQYNRNIRREVYDAKLEVMDKEQMSSEIKAAFVNNPKTDYLKTERIKKINQDDARYLELLEAMRKGTGVTYSAVEQLKIQRKLADHAEEYLKGYEKENSKKAAELDEVLMSVKDKYTEDELRLNEVERDVIFKNQRANNKLINNIEKDLVKAEKQQELDKELSIVPESEKLAILTGHQNKINEENLRLETQKLKLSDQIDANRTAMDKASNGKESGELLEIAGTLNEKMKAVDRELVNNQIRMQVVKQNQKVVIKDQSEGAAKEKFNEKMYTFDLRAEHSDPLMTAFNGLLTGIGTYYEAKFMGKGAYQQSVEALQKAVDSNAKPEQHAENNTGETVSADKLKAEDRNICNVVLIKRNDKLEVQLLNPIEYHDWLLSNEKKELQVQLKDKSASLVVLSNTDKNALYTELGKEFGAAVRHPRELCDYIVTAERQDKLMSMLFASSEINKNDQNAYSEGGDFFEERINGKLKASDSNAEKQTGTLKEEQEPSVDEVKPQEELDITESKELKDYSADATRYDFDKALDALELEANLLDEEQKERLLNDNATKLYYDADNHPFKLKLVRSEVSGAVELHRIDKQDAIDLDKLQKDLDLTLSDDDKRNLLGAGQLDHTVMLKDKKVILYLDKELNVVSFKDPAKMRISQNLEQQMDAQQLDDLRSGKAVKVDDIKKLDGSSFSGWLMFNPRENSLAAFKDKPAFSVDQSTKITENESFKLEEKTNVTKRVLEVPVAPFINATKDDDSSISISKGNHL